MREGGTLDRLVAAPSVRAGRRDPAPWIGGAAVLAGLLVLVAWPVAAAVAGSARSPGGATLASYRDFFSRGDHLALGGRSLGLALVSTPITVGLALVLGWACVRAAIPGGRALAAIVGLPLVAPTFFVALGLKLLAGDEGLLPRGLGVPWSVEGFAGIVLAQILTFLPPAWLVVVERLRVIDPALEDAAESLGAGRLEAFGRVTLSLVGRGLAAAALLVFVASIADFVNPFLIGGGYTVLATEIYARAAAGDLTGAAALAVILGVPCAVGAALLLRARAPGPMPAVGEPLPGRRPLPGGLSWSLVGLGTVVAAVIVAAGAAIVLGSLTRRWGEDWSLALGHYAGALAAAPLWRSLLIAVGAAVAGTGLALLAAYLVERPRAPVGAAIGALALLPDALPGGLVGVGYLLAFGPPESGAGALALVTASVVAWKLPAAFRSARAVFRRLPPDGEEAAMSLGAGRVSVAREIVLPLAGRSMLTVLVSYLGGGLTTASVVVFLVSPASPLAAPTALFGAAAGDLGGACALTMLLLVLSAAVALARPRPAEARAGSLLP